MNDAIDSIMTFINQNNTILIIICIFLIVVLVVYLIENTIKMKKVNNNIEKNKEEIDKKIKNEMKSSIESDKFQEAIVPVSPDVEDIFNEPHVDKIEDSDDLNIVSGVEEEKEKIELPSEESSDSPINRETKEETVDVLYKNDKKLSEILFGNIESQPSGKLDEKVVKIDESSKAKEKNLKELEESANELDRIMKKLDSYNSMNNVSDDDNYSNIF